MYNTKMSIKKIHLSHRALEQSLKQREIKKSIALYCICAVLFGKKYGALDLELIEVSNRTKLRFLYNVLRDGFQLKPKNPRLCTKALVYLTSCYSKQKMMFSSWKTFAIKHVLVLTCSEYWK